MVKFIEGARRFTETLASAEGAEQRCLFESLATGQTPEALFITCADSRIDPCYITGTGPGDLFVCRNPGNFVPPKKAGHQAEATAATIEYALEVLKVPHIVICGHSNCGALSAAIGEINRGQLPYVADWLQYAPVPSGDIEAYTEDNVRHQLKNLRTHRSVAAALGRGAVQLHGWVYSIEKCSLYTIDKTTDKFQRL